MKIILLHIIYLAASVVVSLFDVNRPILTGSERQDRKKSNENRRFKKEIVQYYPPKNNEK